MQLTRKEAEEEVRSLFAGLKKTPIPDRIDFDDHAESFKSCHVWAVFENSGDLLASGESWNSAIEELKAKARDGRLRKLLTGAKERSSMVSNILNMCDEPRKRQRRK